MTDHVRVVTWNAEGMFVEGSKTRRASPQMAVSTIRRLDADIVFIPEFGNTGDIDEKVIAELRSLGYEPIVFSYNQPHLGSYGAALLTRLPLIRHTMHHFTNTKRQFIEAVVALRSTQFRVIGIHLDDRAEELRLQQVPEVASVVNQTDELATVVLGDFNAMHTDSKFARVVRTKPIHYMARTFPHTQLSGMGVRVSEMGRGTTIAQLVSATGLHDLDGLHRRTISAKQSGLEWAPAVRLAKIDWMLGSDGVSAEQYTILPDVGSDHRPVAANLIVRQ